MVDGGYIQIEDPTERPKVKKMLDASRRTKSGPADSIRRAGCFIDEHAKYDTMSTTIAIVLFDANIMQRECSINGTEGVTVEPIVIHCPAIEFKNTRSPDQRFSTLHQPC